MALLVILATCVVPAVAQRLPSLLVIGLEDRVQEEVWREQRLGMGIRGRLAQMCADSNAFILLEEKDLAASVRDALGGYWLREKSAAELHDLGRMHLATGSDWIAYGSLERLGVTRDRVEGLLSGRRWSYHARVRLCLHGGAKRQEICRDGSGKSTTTTVSAVIGYRGDQVSWDQAGPAQAVDRALADAFNLLMPVVARQP